MNGCSEINVMNTIKRFKFIVALCIIIMVVVCFLCACLPNRTYNHTVCLAFYEQPISNYILGDFRITNAFRNKNTDYIGIRPKDQSDFFDFLEASSLFRGKIILKESAMSEYYEYHREKIGNNCFVFACDNYIWLGRLYTENYYKIFEVNYLTAFTLKSQRILRISELILSNKESEYFENINYQTPWNWEELKMFFPNAKVDDNKQTLEISQFNYYSQINAPTEVVAQLIYDKQCNTICIIETSN